MRQGDDKVNGAFLFSQTNSQGVIVHVNQAFADECGHAREALIGANHNMLRHPEMPKALFHVLWADLKKGKVTGAYIKNLTASGAEYWIFAMLLPVEGGHVSIAVKPGDTFLDKVQTIYKDALQREAGGEAQPEELAQALVHDFEALGGGAYEAFLGTAISQELQDWTESVRVDRSDLLVPLDSIHGTCVEIEKECVTLSKARQSIALASVNLRLSAASAGERGRSIDVIAEDFAMVAGEMMTNLDNVAGLLRDCRGLASAARLGIGTQRMQTAILSQITAEGDAPESTTTALTSLEGSLAAPAAETLHKLYRKTNDVPQLCSNLRRSLLALAMVRVMCKREVHALSIQAGSMVMQLDSFVDTSNDRIVAIQNHLPGLQQDLDHIQKSALGVAA